MSKNGIKIGKNWITKSYESTPIVGKEPEERVYCVNLRKATHKIKPGHYRDRKIV